ncbi:circularly permutated Ras protein 1-like [Salvelinus fontinalis]|uniref:circularly permutated Ras protein 1-like n=1 Tax=Salvelinus fontinalis TaxID=8038 RepID=UPI002486BCB8|nr:circularly permutated Ras protein 1-like [Salvelinus fontinalis]
MEFACGFVYVPPSTYQREVQTKPQIAVKRSALLPPPNRIRPRSPPPPPPAPSPELQKQQHHSPEQRITEKSFKNALLPPFMRSQSPACVQPIPGPPSLLPSNSQRLTYDLPEKEPDIGSHPWDPDYSYNIPEGSGEEMKHPNTTGSSGSAQKSAPALPPRPSFMRSCPEYLVLLPDSFSSSKSSSSPSSKSSQLQLLMAIYYTGSREPLVGNPNVILVSLGELISEENVFTIEGEPTCCSQCGSVLDSFYDNVVNVCYFCQSSLEPPTSSSAICLGCQDSVFLLTPGDKALTLTDTLLLFCIDISASMSITSQVLEGKQPIHRSRLQFVQEAVLQSVRKLSETQPHMRVGLITFNNQVTLHGYDEFTSRSLGGAELIDSEYLKEAAFSFPSPPPLSKTRDCLQREILGLSESGATALGPASLVAIAMASRQPGSKVIICTDGKANTDLGNLEVEGNDARPCLSSTIFYYDLGEYAASQGVTVSVLAIEGTDCRLDELGRLADRTSGKVVIASPHELYTEFEEIIENRTIATHCSVTLLLPTTLCVKGEREAGNRVTREVGNVAPDTEITFQFGAREHGSQGEVSAPVAGGRVSVQLQLRYRQKDGHSMLRVLTADKEVTDDSSVVLSSLFLAIIQLNSSQASAALAVRGRFQDAKSEGETQRELMERALEYDRSAEDKLIYSKWLKTMDPIHNCLENYTRRQSIRSDTLQSLTDMGAALLYSMKNSNRRPITLKEKHQH